MPDDALMFCMPLADSLPTATNPGRVSGIGRAKCLALPGEEHGIEIVVIGRLTVSEKSPNIHMSDLCGTLKVL